MGEYLAIDESFMEEPVYVYECLALAGLKVQDEFVF